MHYILGKAVSIIWPKQKRVLCVLFMKINVSRPAICSFVHFGYCPMIGRLVYPCKKGNREVCGVQRWLIFESLENSNCQLSQQGNTRGDPKK